MADRGCFCLVVGYGFTAVACRPAQDLTYYIFPFQGVSARSMRRISISNA